MWQNKRLVIFQNTAAVRALTCDEMTYDRRPGSVDALPSRERSAATSAGIHHSDALGTILDFATILGPSSLFPHAMEDQKRPEAEDDPELQYIQYEPAKEEQFLPSIRQLISKDLSEPYSIYVYRYFLYQWGDLCYMVLSFRFLPIFASTPLSMQPSLALSGSLCMLTRRDA